MKKNYLILFLAIFTTISICSAAWAAGHGRKARKKVGILLVAFGSSEPSAQVSFENIDKRVKAAYVLIPMGDWCGLIFMPPS